MAVTIEKELEEVKGKWQQTQQELDKTKSELHDVREELERSQSQLDEVLGELEQTHFELHQLKEKGESKQSQSDGEVKQELEETKSKLQETEQLLEQSQSQLGETMGVLEEYQSQMEKTMGTLEELQGKLQQKQEELEQVKGELAQKQSVSESQLQKELEETKSQLRETEQLLQEYQSQLQETMEVLEKSHSQLEQARLKEKQEQQSSRSDSELQKELQETKSQLRETEQLLEQYQSQLEETMEVLEKSQSQLEQKQNESKLEVEKAETKKHEVEKTEKVLEGGNEQNRLFKIQNAIVKPILIQGGKWVGGVVFPDEMPEIFRHRRGGRPGQDIVYMDQLIQVSEHNNLGRNNTGDRKIDTSKTYRGTYIYGGPFHPHFGHALTESIHRLWAFDTNVHNGIVFAVSLLPNTNRTSYTSPQWFTQILEILEIPLAKCIWVTNDCTFENIIIPEAGSELSLGQKKWYRFYSEKLQQRILKLTSDLRKNKPEKLFLGRNHIRLGGSLAGDKYLETLLLDEGYISLKPENYDVLEQLAYIINAKKIIFSEGSAIYILELINYLDTEIACIPRRGGNKCFYPHIHSKCRNYIIAGDLADIFSLNNQQKKGIKSIPISKNPDKIVNSLRKHDFASLENWDKNKFLAAEKDIIMTYIQQLDPLFPNQNPANSTDIMNKYSQVRGIIQDNLNPQVSPSLPPKRRNERLNKLASINQSSRYLEIGVSKGFTFNAIEIDYKVAVDPKFKFDVEKYASDQIVFLEVSSDNFFKSHAKEFESFDLIYLDGLHTFEQTFRDFCASLALGHSKTIWLIDDTCPGSYAQAQSSLQRSRQIKKFARQKDSSWMGDVFKVVAAIHDFFPQYSFATFPDHGQTVVWKKSREDFEPKWNSLEIISRLEYGDFVELQGSLFKREPYESIFEQIRYDLSKS